MSSRDRSTGGLFDEPQVVEVIDPSDPEIVQLLRRQLRLAGQAMRTGRAYVKWLQQFLNFCGASKAEQLQESDIRRFLTKKSVEDHCSPRTLSQAKSALRFLFQQVLGHELEFIGYLKIDKAPRLPVVLTADEIKKVEFQLSGTQRLMFQLLYGGAG